MTRASGARFVWACLLLHAVCAHAISYGLRPAMSYALLEQGHQAVWLGVATAMFAAPPFLLALPAGRYCDRYGERPALVGGGIALVLSALVALAAPASLAAVLAATGLLGIGVLLAALGEQAWVMNQASPSRLDHSFGVLTFATSVGQLLGPLLLLLPRDGAAAPPTRLIAVAVLGVAVLTVLLSLAVPSAPRPPAAAPAPGAAAGERRAGGRVRDLLRVPGMGSALFASSMILSSVDILVAYLPLLAQERGLVPGWITLFLVVRAVGSMVSRILLGRLTTRFGRVRVLMSGCALAAGGLILLWLPVSPWVVAALATCYGFTAGMVQPLTMSWVTLITPPGQRGLAASLRLVGNRLGQNAVPLLVAPLSLFGGAGVVFGVTGMLLLATVPSARRAPD